MEPVPRDESGPKKSFYHGEDGFGGAKFDPEPDRSLVQKESAVMKLIELARKHKGLHLPPLLTYLYEI